MLRHPQTMLARARFSLRALLFICLLLPALSVAAKPPVTLLTVDGAIGPASADYLVRGIARAANDGSQLVIIQLDSPGGLDTSMRAVIKAIMSARIPVAAFVAPSGARAASAATFILYASHIAAMAPGTNLGAATPVQLGGPEPGGLPRPDKPPDKQGKQEKTQEKQQDKDGSPLARKQLNDAAAYIRGLAQMRGRNAEWAELAVREAASLPAGEALKLGVIDIVAPDVAGLMTALDGRRIKMDGRELALQTAGAPMAAIQPDWRARLLAAISDPSVALILMTLGIYGLLFEFMSPGAVAPGVIGALCLLLGLYGLQLLPVNYAGLGLILLGISFMIAEAFLPSFGVLGLGGIAAFVAGALILVDTELPDYGIPLSLVVAVAATSAVLMAGTAAVALRTRRRGPRTGPAALVGSTGETLDDIEREGWANVNGETWRVVTRAPLRRGQQVVVQARRGTVLEVVPADYSKTSKNGETP